jgi:uncharacterized protein (DUF433 family)
VCREIAVAERQIGSPLLQCRYAGSSFGWDGQMVTAARATHNPSETSSGSDGGVYLQAEAASLTGLPRSTARRWLGIEREATGLGPLEMQPLVSFHELIGLRVVAALRLAGLGLPEIERGVARARRELGIARPLAWEGLRVGGVDTYFPAALYPRSAANEGGGHGEQALVAALLRDVTYERLAGGHRLASSWRPPGVCLDPTIQHGAPCVAGSRVQISRLKRFIDAGDTPEHLAELFELKAEDIRRAVAWYVEPKRAA